MKIQYHSPRYVVSLGFAALILILTGCGERDAADASNASNTSEGRANRVPNEFQVTVNGETAHFNGVAFNNRFGGTSLELWNGQRAPVVDEQVADEDAEQAFADMVGGMLDSNQLKINLIGVDLLAEKLPYRISGTDEGMDTMAPQRATLQLNHDNKIYMGGAVLMHDVPDDWNLTIERIDGEMLHGSFRATLVGMADSDDHMKLTDGKFALRVRGLTGK